MNRDYIANNLCINRFDAIPVCKGSCILENALNKAQKEEQKTPEMKIKEINLYCQHSNIVPNPIVVIHLLQKKYAAIYNSKPTEVIHTSVFHPPATIV